MSAPTTPQLPRQPRFGLLPVRSPLLRQSIVFLPGCPIRTRTDRYLLAVPRAFSQLAASFLASGSLGILRPPLFPSPRESHSRVFFALKLQSAVGCLPGASLLPGGRLLDFSFLLLYLVFSLIIVNELSVSPQENSCFFRNGLQRYALFLSLQTFLKIFSKIYAYPQNSPPLSAETPLHKSEALTDDKSPGSS